MLAVWEELAMACMHIQYVVDNGLPLCSHHEATSTIISGGRRHSRPVHMVDSAPHPWLQRLTLFGLGNSLHLLAKA